MKMLLNLCAVLLLALSIALPASAGELLIGRGWTQDGVHIVIVSDRGKLVRVTEAELSAAGVDIWNAKAVAAYLDVPLPNFGGCGLMQADKDPDAGGACNADDGVAGTVGADESDKNTW